MKTINVILCELKKILISPYFFIGIAAFTLMCFTSSGYYDTIDMREINIFDMMRMLGTEKAKHPEFTAEFAAVKGFSGWVTMFLSIIVAFPFTKVLCDERIYSEKRNVIIRTGVLRYSLSKLVSAIISAVLLCGIGYLLFTGIVYAVFPRLSPEDAESIFIAPYKKYLLSVALTGAAVSVMPFLLSAFVRNQYFCICIPFLIFYMFNVAISKLDHYMGESKLRDVMHRISPDHMNTLPYNTKEASYTLMFYAGAALVSLIIFQLVQRRCTDVGQ